MWVPSTYHLNTTYLTRLRARNCRVPVRPTLRSSFAFVCTHRPFRPRRFLWFSTLPLPPPRNFLSTADASRAHDVLFLTELFVRAWMSLRDARARRFRSNYHDIYMYSYMYDTSDGGLKIKTNKTRCTGEKRKNMRFRSTVTHFDGRCFCCRKTTVLFD